MQSNQSNFSKMSIKNSKVQKILHCFNNKEKTPEEITSDILKVIGEKDFVKEDISDILNVNFLPLLTSSVLYSIADKMMTLYGKESIKYFTNTIRYLLGQDLNTALNFVILLIIDNNARNREVGRNLWDEMALHTKNFNPLMLTEQQQALFIISMLQDIGNPDFRLPAIMTLFNSENKNIRLILYIQLTKYCGFYLGAVKQLFDRCQITETEESLNFKKYCENYTTFIEKRINCKELNPLYTQADIYEETSREAGKLLKDISSKIHPDNELERLGFKKVRLARGYVWRSHDGRLQQLAHIKKSIPYPAGIHALSALESTEYMLKINNNWDKIQNICDIL